MYPDDIQQEDPLVPRQQWVQHATEAALFHRHYSEFLDSSLISGVRYEKIFRLAQVQHVSRFHTLSIKNHWMDEANPWSRCGKRNSLSNEGIFMILPSQYFPGWIKIYVSVYFSKWNTVEVGLEGNSLVKSTRYLIVITFQGEILVFYPNRPVFNLMILYQLDTRQLTQEKEKKAQWLGVLLGDSKKILRVYKRTAH